MAQNSLVPQQPQLIDFFSMSPGIMIDETLLSAGTGIAESTNRNWRSARSGLRAPRFGGMVRYRVGDEGPSAGSAFGMRAARAASVQRAASTTDPGPSIISESQPDASRSRADPRTGPAVDPVRVAPAQSSPTLHVSTGKSERFVRRHKSLLTAMAWSLSDRSCR